MGMGHPQQSSVPANQSVTNQTQHQLAQMNSNGQLSIHLSHGQMVGQSSQTASAQIMPLNSTMFQVKQLSVLLHLSASISGLLLFILFIITFLLLL